MSIEKSETSTLLRKQFLTKKLLRQIDYVLTFKDRKAVLDEKVSLLKLLIQINKELEKR